MRATSAGLVVAVLLPVGFLAGCGSRSSVPRPQPNVVAPAGKRQRAAAPSAPAVLERCSTATAAAPPISPPVPVSMFPPLPGLPSNPYAVVTDGSWAFVTEPNGYSPHTGLVSVVHMRATGSAVVVRTVTVPGEPFGAALYDARSVLLVANYQGGLDVLSTKALESSATDPVLRVVRGPGSGGDEVVVDGSYAFVPEEDTGDVAVDALAPPRPHKGTIPVLRVGKEVGAVPVGPRPVGIVLDAADGVVYVVSQEGGPSGQGMVTAIDPQRAERNPAGAVVGTTPAGCDPVRITLSPAGTVAWVTDRGADSLLAFRLEVHPRVGGRFGGALLGAVRVGPAPVDVRLVDRGTVALVTDSNRFTQPGGNQTVAVVDTAAVLARRPALVGYLPAGAFPRQFSEDDTSAGTLLFTNYDSLTVSAIPGPDLSWLQA